MFRIFDKREPDISGACDIFGHVMVDSPMWGGQMCQRCGMLDCCVKGECLHSRGKVKAQSFYRLGTSILRKGQDGMWGCNIRHAGAKVTLSSDTLAGLRDAVITLTEAELPLSQMLDEMSDYDRCRLYEAYTSRPTEGWPLDQDGFLLLHKCMYYGKRKNWLESGENNYTKPLHSWPFVMTDKGSDYASTLFYVPYNEECAIKDGRTKWCRKHGADIVYRRKSARKGDVYYLFGGETPKGRFTSLKEARQAYKDYKGRARILRVLPDKLDLPSLKAYPTNLWFGGCTELIEGKEWIGRKYYGDTEENSLIPDDCWDNL